jgi:CRP-like cAMP-binding protein
MINVPNYLDILANAGVPIERFESGQTIFVDGSSGDKMYVVYSGKVAIEREGKLLEELSEGDSFGEMSLIDGAPRSATARQDGLRGGSHHGEGLYPPCSMSN